LHPDGIVNAEEGYQNVTRFLIPIAQKTRPGVKGTLRIEARSWK
jgi:hypothetical protein